MTKSPTVLLVGAGGFIGTWIRDALLADAWDVIGISRRDTIKGLLAGYTPVIGDATAIEVCEAWVNVADAIVYNAAHIPASQHSPADAESCLRVNALAPLAYLSRITQRPRPFIYISSGQGYCISHRPAREDDPFMPSGHAAFYLSSKLLGDIYMEHYRTMHGLPSTVLRIGSVYGPGQARGMVAQFVRNALAGNVTVVHNGGQYHSDLTFVGDVGQAVVAVLRRGGTGIYNIGTGQVTSALAAAKLVMKASGADESLLSVEPPTSGAENRGFGALDVTRAKTDLFFRPTTIEEGIFRTVRDWRS